MSETAGKYSAADAIQCQAQVFKIQTLVDGGMRLTLDLVEPVQPETIVQLIGAKQPGIILECAFVAVLAEKATKNNTNDRKIHF